MKIKLENCWADVLKPAYNRRVELLQAKAALERSIKQAEDSWSGVMSDLGSKRGFPEGVIPDVQFDADGTYLVADVPGDPPAEPTVP